MSRVREMPYNYTSFSDREITLRLLGAEGWALVSELLGEIWAIQRNPYLEDELVNRPKRRAETLGGMRRRLAEIEARRAGNLKVARLLELARDAERFPTGITLRQKSRVMELGENQEKLWSQYPEKLAAAGASRE